MDKRLLKASHRAVTRKKGALEQQLQQITTGNSDIIIGTQMITKGHDFQKVALVGIINVDAGFYSPDFHAPVPGIHLKQANKFRFALMITTTTRKAMQQILSNVYPYIAKEKKVKISMDIDPIEIK